MFGFGCKAWKVGIILDMEHGVRWHELEVLLGEKEKCEYVKRNCKELEEKWGWIRIGLRRVSLTWSKTQQLTKVNLRSKLGFPCNLTLFPFCNVVLMLVVKNDPLNVIVTCYST